MSQNAVVLCACGCGEPAAISTRNNVKNGWVKGQPRKYARFHYRPKEPMDRFIDKVMLMPNGCWEWTGKRFRKGYGCAKTATGREGHAHRVSYEFFIGPIPTGHQLHHECRNRACVNPWHCRPVTPQEHAALGFWATRTHCKRGHPLVESTVRVTARGRRCLICHRDYERRYRERRGQ